MRISYVLLLELCYLGTYLQSEKNDILLQRHYGLRTDETEHGRQLGTNHHLMNMPSYLTCISLCSIEQISAL
ncbi:hypothetical protein BKA65DRAFT_141029 [Rhexocercosporidium sp. MPI-PUGE-AT-0058]|nr:hypothetical protein BKA65DRAFT_141029 [Rhexocercosporidium sp. MPI-PUGE-AT-0058]